MKRDDKRIVWFSAAIIASFFLVVQVKSFDKATPLFRDQKSNVFQEIQILKTTNENLRSEVDELSKRLDQLSDQGSALDALEEEAQKYKKLTGNEKVYGTGVSIKLFGEITTPWMIDLVNEFFNNGAQAVAVNGIRLTNTSVGFDTLPQGQILLNGSILSAPYVFDVIGESKVLVDSFELAGGIFDRLQANFPALRIDAQTKEIIQID